MVPLDLLPLVRPFAVRRAADTRRATRKAEAIVHSLSSSDYSSSLTLWMPAHSRPLLAENSGHLCRYIRLTYVRTAFTRASTDKSDSSKNGFWNKKTRCPNAATQCWQTFAAV